MAKPKYHHLKAAYKSGLETKFKAAALSNGWDLPYEQDKIKYEIPASTHTYTPDFTVSSNVYIETKGLWVSSDRNKALLIKEQHPHIKILYVFQRNNALYKGSKTSYLEWCSKKGLDACTFSDTYHWQEFIRRHI